jgi:hypothetical protein
MTASVHATGHWAAAHRTALLVLLVAAAIVAALTVVSVRLVSGAVPVPSSPTISQTHLSTTDDACQVARPGQAC